MGSIITLGIGHLELDWAKNTIGRNHSKLFLPGDLKNIPYYYADNVVEMKPGYARRLSDVKRRLELLGYSLNRVERLYAEQMSQIPSFFPKTTLTFKDFVEIMVLLDVEKIGLDDLGDYDLGEFASHYLFAEPEFIKTARTKDISRYNIGEVFENLDPYITLRVIMENPQNLDKELLWRYQDVLDGGWVEKDDICQPIDEKDKILIVTEGSSDSFIIQKALDLLYPDIKDFFRFVDMEENYPFTGTGNLYRFAQGLASINIQNNVLIVYDNDLEGTNKFEQSRKLPLPPNLKVIKLPDHKDFSSFAVLGPNGKDKSDINGLAVAIECFLDLSYCTKFAPCVRWTTYDDKSKKYQGELINKESYTKKFSKLKRFNKGYNFNKLEYLINYIYQRWTGKPVL